jgi:hypothetical protein
MWQAVACAVMVMTIAAGAREVNLQDGTPAVRPERAAIRDLIESGRQRSATFRDLNAGLDQTNVVVYVRFSPCLGGVPACLVWAAADATARLLLVKIDRFGRSPDELTALLAHELQHAHEVAADPDITDPASFRKSFASHGWTHGAGFETEAAMAITRKVTAELTRAERDGNVARGRP